MIQIRPFNSDEDYSTVYEWWTGHGFPAISDNKLPPFGWIATADGIPVAASWAYMCNGGTGVAMIEWSVTNPGAGRTAALGLSRLIEFMISELNRLDYDFILTATKIEGLIKLFKRHGFEPSDEGMTHLINIKAS